MTTRDPRLEQIIRDAVVAELGRAASPTAPAPGGAGRPEGRAAPPLEPRAWERPPDPARHLLAKKAALWAGAPLPLPPVLGGWRPRGDRAAYLGATPARLGVGRAGVRYRTETILAFQADHAAARDAVAATVDADLCERLGFLRVESAAADRREFLLRPDLGRRLSPAGRERIAARAVKNPQVQIVAADGLSATAIAANLPVLLPRLLAALQAAGLRAGTPVAVTNGRVAVGDEVARLTGADVLVMFVGERPGLKTDRSLGAYVTWMKVASFHEAMRFVVSNVHEGGTPPEAAADEIVGLVKRALAERRTGVDVG